MSANRILDVIILVSTSLEFRDILKLGSTSKGLWKIIHAINEIHCTSHKLCSYESIRNTVSSFPDIKQLSLNAFYLDWRMLHLILNQQKISLLTLTGLNLRTIPTLLDISETTAADVTTAVITQTTAALPRQWLHIRKLDLYKCPCTGEVLEYLICSFKNILMLSLHGCIYIRDKHINCILSGELKFIESIFFSELLSIQQLVVPKCLQESLKSLRINDCSFLRDILFNMESADQIFQSLIHCDLSRTAIALDCINNIVAHSPRLQKLIIHESLSILGSLSLLSKSLLHLDLQHSSKITELDIDCPNLTYLNIRGCSRLKKLSVQSFLLQNLDLAMLTRLSILEVNCQNMEKMCFDGCRKLKRAKVSSISPFSRSFPRKYYHNVYLEKHNFQNDLEFFHFGCSKLKLSQFNDDIHPLESPSKSIPHKSLDSYLNQFQRRSSSI
jgi:hypothetical protein